MSYQTLDHAIGTSQNLELILSYIDGASQSVVDIGCNQGVLACSLALHGFNVHGIEGQEVFLNHGIKKAKNKFIENIKFTHTQVSLNNINLIADTDVIILLSVHHQIVKNVGIEEANLLLVEIFKSAKKQFFFQPATIYEKYGQEMPWAENDLHEIEEYFLTIFKPIREFKFQKIGLVDNRLPNSEPVRPLYLFDFQPSSQLYTIPKSPFCKNRSENKIFRIPINKCYGHYWQSFGNQGWHFLREQVKQLKDLNRLNKNLNVTETVLYKYYEDFRPINLSEAGKILRISSTDDFGILGLQNTKSYQKFELMNPNINAEDRSFIDENKDELMPEIDSYHCGPRTKDQVMEEINRLTRIYQSISQYGYKPDLHDDGYIRGNFLSNGNDWVFLITGGTHRLATMSELDYQWIKVRIQPGRPARINLDDLSSLPAIQNGAILESEVNAFYKPYFCQPPVFKRETNDQS